MKISTLQLPWASETVPHAILDILRGCNVRCRDCYNLQPDYVTPLSEIGKQLDALMKLRRLQSVSIVGGEITLHPNLVEVVRMVRGRGLYAELFTNGVELNDSLLAQLKEAGANVVFLHIEHGQRRPDLPDGAGAADLRQLRAKKAALVAAQGIEVGLAVTVYPDRPEELEEAVAFTLASPHVCYLLVTWWRDVSRMPPIRGDITNGLYCDGKGGATAPVCRETRPDELCRWMSERFRLSPFASLGSNLDPADLRWLSFMVDTVHRRGELVEQRSLRPTWLERAFLDLSKKFRKRYPFYQRQSPGQTGAHLLLNGLVGGGLTHNLKLLASAVSPGARLSTKRLLFQWPAMVTEQGRVIHCRFCPDAVLKGGRLVPLCISDRITATEPARTEQSSVLVRK